MRKIRTLEDAFVHGLSDIYSGEKQLTKALPKLAKAASNEELAEGFENHKEETEDQIERIERIVDMLEIKLERITCEAMKGLIEEGQEVIQEIEEGPVRDVMLIAGGQKVEHYEIATYGCLVEMAKKLGFDDAADLLQETLDEEKATDKKLNKIAISQVNEEAMSEAA
jgi:ferritin-like metal-binding protein YciE